MFEFHAWLLVRASPGDEDDEAADRADERARDFARHQVERLAGGAGMAEARVVNGELLVHLADLANHRSGRVEEAVDVFERIAREQPGSYGMFYFRDDEEPGKELDFQVLVARRGEVRKHSDPYFSPVSPMIED